MEREFKAFFEGTTGEKFKEAVKRYTSREAFKEHYAQDEWVDTSDIAEVGLIKVSETNWYPTQNLTNFSDASKTKVQKLLKVLESGKPLPPVIAERSHELSPLDKKGNPLDNAPKVDGYFIRDGIHRLAAYEKHGLEFIPAIVYYTADPDITRSFDKLLPMEQFLGIDFNEIFNQVNSQKTSISNPQREVDTLNLLQGEAYFEKHPDHILGDEYSTTNAYGKEVTKVRGKLADALKKIKVKASAKENNLGPLDSPVEKTLENIISDEKAQKNIKKALKSKKTKVLKIDDRQSFQETLKRYNKELSEDEIRAWIWYQRKNSNYLDEKVILNKKNGWSAYIIRKEEENTYLKQWLGGGIIAYFEGDFIPSVLYYAGNIYKRQATLLRESEKIIEEFGQEIYDRQWEGLEQIKPKRLSLTDEVVDNRLVIKPISDLAHEIKIQELADGTTFKSSYLAQSPGEAIERSLFDAFIVWLNALAKDEFKRSTPYEIEYYYLKNRTMGRRYDKEEKLRIKENSKEEGDALFSRFLAEGITADDKNKIEQLWNSRFNGYVAVNYFKVPIGFECSATFKNKPLFIRAAQREGLGFLAVNGSGCIAYDVGVGKTMTGILSIAQAMESGMCKRPLIVVPNQTYKNWLSEIRGLHSKKGELELSGVLPQYGLNDLYNLGDKYLKKVKNKKGVVQAVANYSITVMTYEGLRRLGFNESTWDSMGMELYGILNQGVEQSKRGKSQLYQRVEDLMGRSIAETTVNIEDLGFDYLLIDEAHNAKKVFSQVKGRVEGDDQKRERSRYQIQFGQPSTLALKTFMLSQYILRENQNKNVVLLTATPFTNNPLEVFSMLAIMGHYRIVDQQIANLQGFFNHFIKTSMMLTINAKMKPERKEVVLGFNNLIALQRLIFRFIDYKSGKEANIQRPQKWVLPLTHKVDGERIIPLPIEEQISTNLPMTQEQKELAAQLEQYITGDLSFDDFCLNPTGIEESAEEQEDSTELDESNLSDEEQEGARVLRGISLARQIAFSPYLFSCHSYQKDEITPQKFIDSSPKLQYVMDCIRSVKAFHEKRNERPSAQVIYANAAVDLFPLIKDYLVEKVGYQSSEVGIIKGGMSSRQKEAVKDKFQSGEMLVLIGSRAIKEGINLQNRTSVLYNLWLDWNPTDLKQLEGRIWRFGNQFANVRIVLPLMEDSIDTAIFQKLEEKTSRINEIWHRSGQENSLKLEEFNPAELKMGLITNPKVLAEITVMEEREILKDEIARLSNQIEELTEIKSAKDAFDRNFDKIESKVKEHKPLKKGQSPRKVNTILKLYKDLLDDPEVSLSYIDRMNYEECRKSYQLIQRGLEKILEPRGLDLDFNKEQVLQKIKLEIEEIEQKIADKTGTHAIERLSKEIIKERIKKGYKPKPVQERVKEFASLNDKLLTEKMNYGSKKDDTAVAAKVNDAKPKDESAEIDKLMKEMEALLKAAA